jgi:hypothetical protein
MAGLRAPLPTLRCALAERQRIARGHRDSLDLRCTNLPFASPCRFIPALSLNSTDPRVSTTVNRLAAPARATAPIRNWQTEQLRSRQPTGWLPGLVATILRLSSGGLATDMMRPAWSAWWRLREYAADDYAARLGQADALAGFFEADGMLYDAPIRRIWASKETHPPTALRIDRLRQHRQQQLDLTPPAPEPSPPRERQPEPPPG